MDDKRIIVYVPMGEKNPLKSLNPYVCTLTQAVERIDARWKFVYNKDFLWTDECERIAIVHFMWPHLYAYQNSIDTFERRILFLKSRGVKIICTCHNIVPHSGDEIEAEYYSVVYRNCDGIIHLGNFSYSLFCSLYPKIHNVVIPHHIYDDRYKVVLSLEDGLTHLGLPHFWGKYILCMGAFRTPEEAMMVRKLSRKMLFKRVAIIAPSMMQRPRLSNNCKQFWLCMKWIIHKIIFPNIIILGKNVDEEDVPYYFAASSAVLIQRLKILNSGNVPLAFYLAKAVAGPDVGNVGELLKATGNPVFNPLDSNSVFFATMKALSNSNLGLRNRFYAEQNLGSELVAKKTVNLYITLTSNSKNGWAI